MGGIRQYVLCLSAACTVVGVPGVASTRAGATRPADVPGPRIESVVMLPRQPQESDPDTIWYDDFDGPEKAYTESAGGLDDGAAFGGAGKSMLCVYEKGKQGKGNRKVFFGDAPTGKVVQKGKTFQEVYWRIYVRHQPDWTGGGPDKMSRATSIVSPRWDQAMIAHVWSAGEALTLDPASGVRGDRVVTTRYNDFDNLHWLGNKPASTVPISSSLEAGWWVCVEARAKLNAPGRKDGVNQLWIDGRLACQRENLDWRGGYDGHGINAVFLEAYWNKGSPVTQCRWYDNFVISAKPIGPVACPANPTLLRTPWQGPGRLGAWEVEIAGDAEGKSLVWRSKALPPGGAMVGAAASRTASAPASVGEKVTVNAAAGGFLGDLAGKDKLAAGKTFFCRIRQKADGGEWSDWSHWHQPFVVEATKPVE